MKVGDAWVPTFPNARYLLNRAEFEFWSGQRPQRNLDAMFGDSPLAAQTRRAQLAGLADGDTLLIGTHFAPPTAGHVPTDAKAFRFDTNVVAKPSPLGQV